MKKVISIILMFFLLISLGITTVNAAESCSASVSASSRSPKVGDTITVTVSFSKQVGAAQFSLSYNNSVLQYVSGSGSVDTTNQGSSLLITHTDSTGGQQPIRSATFKFKVKAEGSSNLSMSGSKFRGPQGERYTSSGGSTSITAKNPEPPKENNEGSGSSSNNGSSSSNNGGSSSSSNNGGSSSSSNSGSSSNSNNNSDKNNDPTFRDVNQTVYAKSEVNVRKSWNTSSAQLGKLKKGDNIKRTGIGSNGWDRVTYNGQTAYINHSYLTTTKPGDNEDENKEDENTVENNENNEENNEVNNEINNEENNEINEELNNEEMTNLMENNEDGSNQVEEHKPNYVLYIIIAIIIIAIIIIIIASVYESKRNRRNRRK